MPLFPPIIAPHFVEPSTLPLSAKRIAALMAAHGFAVKCAYGRFVEIDTNAFDENGNLYRPRHVIVRDPVIGEDGQPVLTPTGKQKTTERATDEVVQFDDVLVQGHKGDLYAAARWEAHPAGGKYTLTEAGVVDGKTKRFATFDDLKAFIRGEQS